METTSSTISGRDTPLSAPHHPDGPRVAGGRQRPRPLRAHLDYDPDGVLLFRLSGHEEERFARVLAGFRRMVPPADREWVSHLDAWVLYGGWDEELLELLADYFEPDEVLMRGQPLLSEDGE